MSTEDNFSFVWYAESNPALTLKVRIARLYFIYKLCDRLNIPTMSTYSSLLTLTNQIKNSYDDWNALIGDKLTASNYVLCPSLPMIDQTDEYIDQRIQYLFPTTVVNLVVTAHHCNGAPELFVKYNGVELYRKLLLPGQNNIVLPLDNVYNVDTILEIGMDNKHSNDTEVTADGNISADKKIIFEQIIIDKIDVLRDQEYFYQESTYIEDGIQLEVARPGLFKNSSICFAYQAPFWKTYLSMLSNTTDWVLNNEKEPISNMLDKVRSSIENFKY
jgi:hypothetical protein